MAEKVTHSNEMVELKDLVGRKGQEISLCELEDFGNIILISYMKKPKAIFRNDKEAGILHGLIEGNDVNGKENMVVLEANTKSNKVIFYYGNESKIEYFGDGKISFEGAGEGEEGPKNLIVELMIDHNDISKSYDEPALNILVKRVSEKMIKKKEKKNTPPETEMLKALKEMANKEALRLKQLDIKDAGSFTWLHSIEKPGAVFRFDEDTGILYGIIEGEDENGDPEFVVMEANIYEPTFGLDGLYNAKYFFESKSDAIGTKYIEYGQLYLLNAEGKEIGIESERKIDYGNMKVELLVNDNDMLFDKGNAGYTSNSHDLVFSVFEKFFPL